MVRIVLVIILFGLTHNLYNQTWMIPPVKHKIGLSGTFGELRTNHFHTGVDIKSSNGRSGDQVFAVANGHISRIRISKDSYGNALYIDHPNGKTTVYAHLHSFTPSIANWIKVAQYNAQSFEIDTLVDANLFAVQQGQQIGLMGNSGSSFGAHLHFEIRDTESEVALNPLANGLKVYDTSGPKMEELRFHYLDAEHLEIGQSDYTLKSTGKGKYTVPNNRINIPAWRTGISIFVRDLMDGTSNRNGIYRLQLIVDDQQAFSFEMDSISFDQMGYCNAHIDYGLAKQKKQRNHRTYKLPNNQIPLYTETDFSIIKLYENKARNIRIIATDYYGNSSEVAFELYRDPNIAPQNNRVYNYRLEPGVPHLLSNQNIKLYFDRLAFYETQYLDLKNVKEEEENMASDVYFILNKNTPIQTPAEIYIKPWPQIDSSLYPKICIVNCEDKKFDTYGGNIAEGMIGEKVKGIGKLSLYIDTIPPSIEVKSFPYNVANDAKIQFRIDDNLSPRGNAHDLQYKANVDGTWILMEYDLKNKTITHTVDDHIGRGKHTFQLEVWDDRQNRSVFTKEFIKN